MSAMLPRRVGKAIILGSALSSAVAALPGLPQSGNALWFTQPGRFDAWSNDWLPIGNGFLAAMVQGTTSQEAVQLNIESLWSGGPFQDPNYNGGNKVASERATTAEQMQGIRQAIFQSSTGTIDNIEQLSTDAGAYGSYVGAGYLLSTLDIKGDLADLTRWLDMDAAVARTLWTQGNTTFLRETFCSHPIQACVQHIGTTDSSELPALTYAYSIAAESGIPTPTVSCFDNSTLKITGSASDPGMAFEILARASASTSNATISCTPVGSKNATLSVTGASAADLLWVGGTDYDMDAGDEAHNFSFKGVDPHDALVKLLNAAGTVSTTYEAIRDAHSEEYSSLMTRFQLNLGQEPDFDTPTDQLKGAYQTDTGNTYLEWLTFNFGRYLLAGSARGTLPANLQGKWGKDSSNPWGADYHSNINIQMNYWFAEMTQMDVVTPLFDYFEKTWVPRGTQTAQNLYNISQGWVTHNEMNIFGHTGMKGGGNTAQWSDYPEANAWMMIHVWDHFDFTLDQAWFQSQGWPLLKSAAQFHLQKLIPDEHFNDSTLVVAPCNSPEQVPITLGCAHAQQLIWQLFNAIVKGFPSSGDSDQAFLEEVQSKLKQIDDGIHIGSWGQLQEWKVDMDSPTDTHRHLSHLIGLYPGYAVTSFNTQYQQNAGNLTRDEVIAAAQTSLIHRGNGTGPDADAGWEKVWRAACWAQLGNAKEFYHELSYALERNYAPNLFSLYSSGPDAIFQIDANFGFPAALLNALVQSPDQPSLSEVFEVNLLPALPDHWSHGSIDGVRLRGGFGVGFSWDNRKLTRLETVSSLGSAKRQIRFLEHGKEIKTVTLEPGVKIKIL
ncbi:Six-hairpin glycosidase-like protein [Fomes fomentarius]|nr:Six-hairpin glycosidase-like protein [Fomes fomentarius]